MRLDSHFLNYLLVELFMYEFEKRDGTKYVRMGSLQAKPFKITLTAT